MCRNICDKSVRDNLYDCNLKFSFVTNQCTRKSGDKTIFRYGLCKIFGKTIIPDQITARTNDAETFKPTNWP